MEPACHYFACFFFPFTSSPICHTRLRSVSSHTSETLLLLSSGSAPKPAAPVDPWGAPPSVPPMKSSDPWAANSTPASDPWSSGAARPKTSNPGELCPWHQRVLRPDSCRHSLCFSFEQIRKMSEQLACTATSTFRLCSFVSVTLPKISKLIHPCVVCPICLCVCVCVVFLWHFMFRVSACVRARFPLSR